MKSKNLTSIVSGHEGLCIPIWLNGNKVTSRLDGGITGYFKNLGTYTFLGLTFHYRMGNEFHGIIKGGIVSSTRDIDNYEMGIERYGR